MRLPHLPGRAVWHEWDESLYNAHQLGKLRVLRDLAYAACSGFLHTRMPTPGKVIPVETAEARARQAEEAWNRESGRMPGTVGLPVSKFPLEARLYLQERLESLPPPYHYHWRQGA
jgi:hypothetical protein